MNIRTLFKTEEELAKRFGVRFMRMFHGLLERYSRKGKPVQSYALKAAALAFVFYGAAEDGNAELMRNFDSMLHGSYSEQLCLEDQTICLEDDLNATLVWDIAALMLEASGVQFPQEAFDMVGKHVWMAYKVDGVRSRLANGRLWFPVCKYMMLEGLVPEGDFMQAVRVLQDLYPDVAFNAKDLSTLNVLSFRGRFEDWKLDDSPIKDRTTFFTYKNIGVLLTEL